MALPAASAGAALNATCTPGEFHGVIAATTPIGSTSVYVMTSGRSAGSTRPSSLSASSPK
jgi:hypothetical protein